jgi:hypothetical protein
MVFVAGIECHDDDEAHNQKPRQSPLNASAIHGKSLSSDRKIQQFFSFGANNFVIHNLPHFVCVRIAQKLANDRK